MDLKKMAEEARARAAGVKFNDQETEIWREPTPAPAPPPATPAPAARSRPGLVRTPTVPVTSEEYVCRGCRTVKSWTMAELGDDQPPLYTYQVCDVCQDQEAAWAAVRVLPEMVTGEPAGTWRPKPGAMQGVWEKSSNPAMVAAEKARRIATL